MIALERGSSVTEWLRPWRISVRLSPDAESAPASGVPAMSVTGSILATGTVLWQGLSDGIRTIGRSGELNPSSEGFRREAYRVSLTVAGDPARTIHRRSVGSAHCHNP